MPTRKRRQIGSRNSRSRAAHRECNVSATTRRRISALARASERRERMEADLRAELEARRREHAELQARADDIAQQLMELHAITTDHRARIARMMTGEEPFSLDSFDACRRYLDIVDHEAREAQTALDAQHAAIATKDDEVIAARRAIAQNRGRIDVCRERVRDLERVLERIALDAEDEAAEELTLAKRRSA
jgi:type III secretion system HrpB7-like protein